MSAKTKTITVAMDASLHRRVTNEARKEYRTGSQHVHMIIEQHYQRIDAAQTGRLFPGRTGDAEKDAA